MSVSFWIWLFFSSFLGLLLLFFVHFLIRKRRIQRRNEWKKPEEIDKESPENIMEKLPAPKIQEKKLPKLLVADLGRAIKFLENKKYEEAARLFLSVLAYDEYHLSANSHLALLSLQMGDFLRAEEFFRKALSVSPDDPALLTNFAIALFEQKMPLAIAESLDALEKAAKIDPKNAERHANYGQSLFFAGRLEDALVAFSEAVRRSPRRLEFLFFLGDTLLALQKYSEARETFERILRISPNNNDARTEFEKLELRLGSREEKEKE